MIPRGSQIVPEHSQPVEEKLKERVPCVGFALCGVASGAMFLSSFWKSCMPCSSAPSQFLPLAATALWLVLSCLSTRWPTRASVAAVFCTLAHAGFVAGYWSDACPLCLALLLLECLCCGVALLGTRSKLAALGLPKPRYVAALILCFAATPLGGALLGGVLFYSGCPRGAPASLQWQELHEGSVAALVLDPQCPACEATERGLGSVDRLHSGIRLVKVDRCSAPGRSIIRQFSVQTFPTLLVLQEGRVRVSVSGTERVLGQIFAQANPDSVTR